MDELPPLRWSAAVSEAEWISERLGLFSAGVTSVVPSGFEAYARILHPAEEPGPGGRLVRWRDVAVWSGIELTPDAPFHSVALPPVRPEAPPPWSGRGPRQGRLSLPDALVLAEVLGRFTSTPERCWFGLWAGYGFDGLPLVAEGSPPAEARSDPVPSTVRAGPLVRLPNREYLLYTGAVTAIVAPAASGLGQTANLAWPDDHAWCVASEIDLTSTYVGGSEALVERLVSEERLEAVPADPGDPVSGISPYVASLVDESVQELLATGHVRIATSMGTVEGWLERPTRWRSAVLRTRALRLDGSRASGSQALSRAEDLRNAACLQLAAAVIGLVESWP